MKFAVRNYFGNLDLVDVDIKVCFFNCKCDAMKYRQLKYI